MIGDGELWYSHDGDPVRLGDILAIALSSASTKKADPSATGRFGIGLGTIEAISPLFTQCNDKAWQCAPIGRAVAGSDTHPVPWP